MSLTVDPDVDQPVPPVDGTGDDDGEPGRPWWHEPWRLMVLAVAVLFLGGAIGYAFSSRSGEDVPKEGSVDVGFLQDMRWHHDQAVRMALYMLDKPAEEQDPRVRSVASDILRSQQFENGVMAGQLRSWGQAEANQSGVGMAWMGMPVPIDRMLGMASDEELAQLRAATGRDADLLFLRLMTAHHEGGLHMMVDAEARAATDEVRTFAESFRTSQEFELNELRNLTSTLATT